jgi:hypothetical protein
MVNAFEKRQCHSVMLLGDEVTIGLFRSSTTNAHISGDIFAAEKRLSSGVENISFDMPQLGSKSEVNFEVGIPIGGMISRFQWKLFGKLRAEETSVFLQVEFRLPKYIRIYFVFWFVFLAVFTSIALSMALKSESLDVWLLPLAGVAMSIGGYVFLRLGRDISRPSMRRVASQINRCFEQG